MEPRRPHRPHRPGRPKPKKSGTKAIVIAAAVGGAVVVGFVAVVLVMQMAKSRRSDPRLFGTWKSDADATVAERKKTHAVTEEQEHKMKTMLFGKMKVTYTADTLTTDVDGTVESQSYEVVRKDADSVTIKTWSPLDKQDVSFRIRFIGTDTYWVHVPEHNFTECFRRIN